MTGAQSLIDKRLLGTWKSDRRRTFERYKPLLSCPPKSFQKFKAMFGTLIIHWSPRSYYTNLDDGHKRESYEIVASDDFSVVIRVKHEIYEFEVLKQIHFEDDYYWIALGGGLVEWFRRVK